MEFARQLQTQIMRDRKLSKPCSVYVTPDSSPTRQNLQTTKGEEGLYFLTRNRRNRASDLTRHQIPTPQTDSGNDSDASRRTMTSNQDR